MSMQDPIAGHADPHPQRSGGTRFQSQCLFKQKPIAKPAERSLIQVKVVATLKAELEIE